MPYCTILNVHTATLLYSVVIKESLSPTHTQGKAIRLFSGVGQRICRHTLKQS